MSKKEFHQRFELVQKLNSIQRVEYLPQEIINPLQKVKVLGCDCDDFLVSTQAFPKTKRLESLFLWILATENEGYSGINLQKQILARRFESLVHRDKDSIIAHQEDLLKYLGSEEKVAQFQSQMALYVTSHHDQEQRKEILSTSMNIPIQSLEEIFWASSRAFTDESNEENLPSHRMFETTPGAVDYIQTALKYGYELAVISDSRSGKLLRKLNFLSESFDLAKEELFPIIISNSDQLIFNQGRIIPDASLVRKDNPSGLWIAQQYAQIYPNEMLYGGNSLFDLGAAQNAGSLGMMTNNNGIAPEEIAPAINDHSMVVSDLYTASKILETVANSR